VHKRQGKSHSHSSRTIRGFAKMAKRVYQNNNFKGQVLEALSWIKDKLSEHDDRLNHIAERISKYGSLAKENREKIGFLTKLVFAFITCGVSVFAGMLIYLLTQ